MTTGKVNISDGELKSIDVEKGDVRIRKQVTAGKRVVVRTKKTEIDVDAEVITGYLKESLGEEAFEAEG